MKIIEPELGEGKVLMSCKVILEGCFETRAKLIDGKYGMWAVCGSNIKAEDGKWKNSLFTLKNDAYKDFSEVMEETYRKLMSVRGKDLEALDQRVIDPVDIEVQTGTTFTSEDIPFM